MTAWKKGANRLRRSCSADDNGLDGARQWPPAIVSALFAPRAIRDGFLEDQKKFPGASLEGMQLLSQEAVSDRQLCLTGRADSIWLGLNHAGQNLNHHIVPFFTGCETLLSPSPFW